MDPLPEAEAIALPCAHEFHVACVQQLRRFGISSVCPLCRKDLPPGTARDAEALFYEAAKRYLHVSRKVLGSNATMEEKWGVLAEAEQLEIDEVRRLCTMAASQGYSRAQVHLAIMYSNGQGCKPDETEAAKWLRKASAKGDMIAQEMLGDQLYFSINASEAAKWFKKSADQGRASAQYKLGLCFFQGVGAKKNYVESANYYRKAADQGHIIAQYNLSIMYGEGKGVQMNEVKEAQWCRKAAEQGDPDAQYNTGTHYYMGQGVEQSYAESAKWFRKASDQGYAAAQYNLGCQYEHGQGVPKSDAEAAKWWSLGAEQGHANSQYNLCNSYLHGIGVRQNFLKAASLCRNAASQGVAKAQARLPGMLELLGPKAAAALGPHIPAVGHAGINACATCGVPAGSMGVVLKSCSRCAEVHYCSRHCQLKDWKAHKAVCTPKDN
jgi:TPR repeat protein